MDQLFSSQPITVHTYEDPQASIFFSFHETENVYNETASQTIYFGLFFLAIAIVLKYMRFHTYENQLNPQQA